MEERNLIIEQLDGFIRKYYKNRVIRGSLWAAAVLLGLFIVLLAAEGLGWFSPVVRGLLFWGFVLVAVGLTAWLVALPLMKMYRLGSRISYEQAARIIGEHFPEVKDKLLNLLQLQKMMEGDGSQSGTSYDGGEYELLRAGIAQKTAQLSPVPFKQAVNLAANKKYVKYAAVPLGLIVLTLIVAPRLVTEPSKRIANYNTTYERPAPFRFVVENERLEVAQQEASLAQSRLTATQADNDYRLSLLSLTQLLELPSPEGFTISREVNQELWNEIHTLPSPDVIYQEALIIKPEIQAEQSRLASSAKNIDIAKSAKLPSLSLQGGLGTNYYKTSGIPGDKFFKQLNNNFSQFLGLSLNVPIFNRFETRNNIKNAQLSQYNQQLQLDNVKKNLYKEIQQAYYNAVTSEAKYQSSVQAKRSQEEAFRLMSAKYEYGKANITEFNEAKNNLMKAESDLVRAKYEYLYQNALIEFYRGKDLSF